ncbi:MAG: cytochrome C [Rubrivivax sp.]|nr:cytochrome C [Rubrivivax sp.]
MSRLRPARRLALAAIVVAVLAAPGAAALAAPAGPSSTSSQARAAAPAANQRVDRASPVGAPDPEMARRMLACTPCHGKEGRATSAGYFPRIAGKPAGYLFNQLVNFREGRRPNSAMADLVEHLDDAYLRDIAAYFAALDLPYAPPSAGVVAPALLARGEGLARQGYAQRNVPACIACHGERLTGVLPSLPGLAGLPRDYLLGQLGAWREGDRRAVAPDCMATIARRLDAADIEAVTLWIAAQPPGADMRPAAAGTLKWPLPVACGSAPP